MIVEFLDSKRKVFFNSINKMNSDEEFKKILKEFINIRLQDISISDKTIYRHLKEIQLAITILKNLFIREGINSSFKVSWMVSVKYYPHSYAL